MQKHVAGDRAKAQNTNGFWSFTLMSAIAFPMPQPDILAKRDAIIAALHAVLPFDAVITSEK